MKVNGHPEVCRRAGFTLVELLAVIAVIAVVAGLIIGAVGVAGKKAAVARAHADIGLIAQALELYRKDYGMYIPATNTLFLGHPFDELTNYVPEIRFNDPWGKQYYYTSLTNNLQEATSYEIKSAGPDGTYGSDDFDRAQDDISNRR
jgi:general secretion pathway protein G